MKISKNKNALTFGFLFAFLHLCWSVLVALGLAQGLIDFILNVHMIAMPVIVKPFSLALASTLVLVTFVVGYIFGWLMAFFWNKCFK